jgi:VanZ family protein
VTPASEKEAAPDLVGRRVQRIMLVLWCCFIVYGSFIPFGLSADPDFVRSNLAKLQLFPFQGGTKNFSLPDIASNILLFIPVGFLLSGSGFSFVGPSRARRICASGALALVLATVIELGQLFAVGRRSSGIDVEAGVIGALLGATAACLFHRYGGQVANYLKVGPDEPRLVLVALLVVWLCSDAFYPFAVTLDVSTVWHNLMHARWSPIRGSQGFWLDRVVDETVMFAMLSALLSSALRRHAFGAMAAIMGASAAVTFSGALELGKLFVVGRSPTVENVLFASVGAMLGVTAIPMLVEWRPIRKHPEQALAALALALLVYSELTPFAFALSSSALVASFHRIEWIPFFSYYGANPQSALFDLWKKLLLATFWGFSFARLSRATPSGAACAGLLLGALLETAQVLTVSRIPGVGDVVNFGLGAWIGGAIYDAVERRNQHGGRRYQRP